MDPARKQGGTRGLKLTLALAAGVIALLAIGPLALLWAIGGGSDPAASSGARDAPADTDVVPPPALAPSPRPPVRPAAAGIPATVAATPAPSPEDVDPSWREVPVVFRNRDVFGPVGLYVFAGLRDAEEAMKPCFPATARRIEPETGSAAVLMLYLVSRAGAIDVVDARVDDPGTATADVVECCRAVLRGYEFKTPNAQPGRRYRLKYPLQQ